MARQYWADRQVNSSEVQLLVEGDRDLLTIAKLEQHHQGYGPENALDD